MLFLILWHNLTKHLFSTFTYYRQSAVPSNVLIHPLPLRQEKENSDDTDGLPPFLAKFKVDEPEQLKDDEPEEKPEDEPDDEPEDKDK